MNMIFLLHPISRILMASIFLASGAGKIFAFRQTVELMSSVGFPIPQPFLIAAILLELGGGLGLVLGFKTRYSAAALIMFVLVATVMFHARFLDDPISGQEQIVHTLKNLAIIGGLVRFVADGGGLYSLDRYWERKEIVV